MTKKPVVIICGPVQTRSGYGNHTRDLAISAIKSDKYDVKLVSLPWGSTPMNALEPNNPDHDLIKSKIIYEVKEKPDVWIQVSVPNEFAPQGHYNIGVTAGVETDIVPGEFLEGCNRMDLILATSEFTKKAFLNSKYDKIDDKTKQKIGEVKLDTRVEVLFEGLDLDVYKKTKVEPDGTVGKLLETVDTDFNFLFVGHWLKGDMGQDRKDVGMMIRTFCEAFYRKQGKNRPGLIMKTSHAKLSIMDREMIIQRVEQITSQYGMKTPDIHLIHGDLTDKEMNDLYNHPKVKAMVSFTKGEGYGRPLLEFSITGKPILVPDHSGYLDFLKYAKLIPGSLTNVHPSATDKFILKEGKWFTANYGVAMQYLQECMKDYKQFLQESKRQIHITTKKFSLSEMADLFTDYIDKGLETVPTEVKLNLPPKQTPNRVGMPTLQKI